MALQLRRGTDAERTAGGGVVFAEGELVYITDTEEVYVGDGVTAGGIRITGSVQGSPAQLTQNLDMNTFDIVGSGNITIDGTITASNISGGGGLIEGQEYAIDIMGDVKAADSSIIVDHTSGIVYADFVGDGSLITGVTLNQLSDVTVVGPQNGQSLVYRDGSWQNEEASGGLTEGQTYEIDIRGSIIANDSTLLLNGDTGALQSELITGTNQLRIENGNGIQLQGNENFPGINLDHESTTDISGTSPSVGYGVIRYRRNDINGIATGVYEQGGSDGWKVFTLADGVTFATDSSIRLSMDGNFGVGIESPAEKIDANGNVKISEGGIRFNNGNSYTTNFPSPLAGDLTYDNVESSLLFRSTSGWNKVVYTELDTSLTVIPGPALIAGGSTAELSALDDSSLTGLLAYNTDLDRMVVYQAGSFVPIPNAGSEIGHVLKWDGTQWASSPETGAAPVGSNADFLDGFDSTYFLNYDNLNNTPNLATVATSGLFLDILSKPTTVAGYGITDAVTDFADLGITDGTIGQVLTTDGAGTYTFEDVSGLNSRATVAGTTASIADGADADLDITGYKGYFLYKIQTDGAAWVRIYINDAKRTADASRTEGQDPGPDAGVIAEVITTGAETVIVAPGIIGFNDESPVTNIIPCAVRNKTGSTGTVTVTLTAVEMEV